MYRDRIKRFGIRNQKSFLHVPNQKHFFIFSRKINNPYVPKNIIIKFLKLTKLLRRKKLKRGLVRLLPSLFIELAWHVICDFVTLTCYEVLKAFIHHFYSFQYGMIPEMPNIMVKMIRETPASVLANRLKRINLFPGLKSINWENLQKYIFLILL